MIQVPSQEQGVLGVLVGMVWVFSQEKHTDAVPHEHGSCSCFLPPEKLQELGTCTAQEMILSLGKPSSWSPPLDTWGMTLLVIINPCSCFSFLLMLSCSSAKLTTAEPRNALFPQCGCTPSCRALGSLIPSDLFFNFWVFFSLNPVHAHGMQS